jgi:hypothetical protein
VVPSVRGRERVVVTGLLAATSASTGALVGFVAGVLASTVTGWPPLPWPAVVVVVALAVGLDAIGRPAPLSVRRQVPQLWGRVFSAPTVAVLYGARLGVGPLTILRTWLWWAALVVGATAGPWWSAAVGALFGLARVVVMVAAGPRAPGWVAGERRVSWALAAVALAVAVGAGATAPDGARPGGRAASGWIGSTPTSARTTTTAPVAGGSSTTIAQTTAVPDQGLALALPDEVLAGLERVPDDPARHLGPLDLRAAAAIERDEPAERALLETRHFVGGHARAWRAAGGKVAYASVYEFRTAADAAAYLQDGLTTLEARGARLYPVDAPTGGRGFSQAAQATGGAGSTVSHGVAFTRGNRFALVFVTSPDSSLGPADASAAASAVASVVGR